ncbi:MAG: class C sortase, partial [Collinsella sp.]|nr:class C sortase [Collinsella sp.]
YNAQLAGLAGISAADGGADASTVSSAQLREQYSQLLNLNGDGMMGYITIPRLDETLPIYHGTDEATLQVGVGHIDTSSLPVGGASTHAALSGHRGLPSAKLFTDLDQMKKGDIFFVRVLKSTFAYQVDQIETVLPDQTESLNITAGDDYCTLVTCTPYGINSHRLLVRGHAIPYTDDMDSQVGVTGNPINIPLPYLALMIALAVLAMLLASMLIGRGIEARRDAVHAAAGSRVAGARQAGSSYDVAGTAGAHGAHDSTRRSCHGGKHMR